LPAVGGFCPLDFRAKPEVDAVLDQYELEFGGDARFLTAK
jgi:hypothetical protein